MKIDNFFAELKRRNVYKVAVACVVASGALAQGLSQLLPIFDIPIWVRSSRRAAADHWFSGCDDINPEKAEPELRRAIAVNPNYAVAHIFWRYPFFRRAANAIRLSRRQNAHSSNLALCFTSMLKLDARCSPRRVRPLADWMLDF